MLPPQPAPAHPTSPQPTPRSTPVTTADTSRDADLTVVALREMLGPDRVETDPDLLRSLSVDRYKKYAAVHGVYEGPFPVALARPVSVEQVSRVLAWATEHGVPVLPRTGGTATEGGLEVVVPDTVILDCSGLDEIVSIDPVDMTATAQCGVPLARLEDAAREHGLTTGHSPQSQPVAQMGGLVATRSIGQLSTLYGGIEDMVAGLEAVFPDGHVARIKAVPRRAAGPDPRHLVIGNEGALCVVTEVTVKLFAHRPETRRYAGWLVADFADGAAGLREVMAQGYRPSVARLYSPEDAAQHSWFTDLVAGPDGKPVRNLVVMATEGPERVSAATMAGIEEIFSGEVFEAVEDGVVRDWFENLNWGPEKLEAEKQAMLDRPHVGFTTEVAIGWSGVAELYESVVRRVREEFDRAEDLTMLGAHSSHSYPDGTNLYFVYDYDVNVEPREELTAYHLPLNAIVVEEALRLGGSMTHHHGIGKYRTPWTEREHGSAYALLRTLKETFDPAGIMNPGTIFPLDGA
ncbi:FAD-binding oxidoreductase [Nocardioidaceae bacterium]|nr:FAD-binding oxidoreductase [Nocardioidaceae bacterium]